MNDFAEQFEIIPGQLYYCTKDKDRHLTQSSKFLYFCTDSSLLYTPFFADFGPLNIGLTYNFCEQLDTLLTQGSVERKPVIYYSSTHPHHRSNSAVLICAYMIFVKGLTAEIAYQPFIGITPMLTTFRDAAFAINTYPLTVLDCARAFYRAHCLHHFVYSTFDVFKHDHLSKLENGDISWIIPGKFIAFSGPVSTPREISPGVFALSPEGYVPLFKSLGVTCVVRFNKKCYDRNIFVRSGIKHVDLYYEDGGNPTDAILQAFLSTCENERGCIAVHCKAGLGRTGTNIAAYMMKHYGYSAKEATAWCRVCRPGCVVGPQQQYLETIQERMWQEGRRYRHERQNPGNSQQNNNSIHSRGVANTSARLSSEVIGSSHEHVDSSLTSRILKKQEQLARSNPSTSRTGGGILSRTTNNTERERTPSISRPNTSSVDNVSQQDRERRDSRGSRKGSGTIDPKQLPITSSSRPKTSYTDSDVTATHNREKNSFASTTSTSNGSIRSVASNSSGAATGQSQSEEKISLSRMLWSSTTKTKLKSSSISPTPTTSQSQSLQSKDSNPRKNSFGKSNIGNSSLGMKKLSIN